MRCPPDRPDVDLLGDDAPVGVVVVGAAAQVIKLFQWNSTFFLFWFIIEGTTEKVLQFKMQLKSIYSKNLGFIEQKMYFWTLPRGSKKKKIL
jgi:hypothetical protein